MYLSHRILVGGFVFTACQAAGAFGQERPFPPKIAEASDEGEQAMAGFKLPANWKIGLFAAEPDVANVVAFDVDRHGRVFLCESFRQNQGVTDNRGHDETWLKRDLAAQTVADRVAYHRELLGAEAETYTDHDDRIRLLVDTDGDGRADKATVYASRFNQLEDGTGAGVLVRDENVYFTNIPKLYNLVDRDGDGVADDRIVMSDGYGVRVAFRGHDMHGLIIGPDGRLYFSIGDRGYHVMTPEGELLHDPASGAVFRCDLDGKNLEVFAVGLRNPQELAFNDYGDLFTGDNNSDSGDQARLVHVLQDGDSGWRMYYQYLPDRGPFNQESIWKPFHDQQPAYLVPPITNFADGPSGLAFYPGTGFGEVLKDRFLLADFRGGSSSSGIRSFKLDPDGAFYRLAEDDKLIWSVLATDVAFGPDGAIYISDWVNGWNGEGKGRIYRITDPEAQGSDVVRQVQRMMGEDWKSVEVAELAKRLSHPDRRIRNEAQWELARREAWETLGAVAQDQDAEVIPRLHAFWGLDQIAREHAEFNTPITEIVAGGLSDDSPHIRAFAVKMVGERGMGTLANRIVELLADDSPRVRYFAARAAGDLQIGEAFEAIVQLLSENDNRDPALRHGGVMGLVGIGNVERITALQNHPSANVRRAAVVALRHLSASEISQFLRDGDARVVAEAARAIHDRSMLEAYPALASLISIPMEDQVVIRRVLNANYRLGEAMNAAALAQYAGRSSAPKSMRMFALSMLESWSEPDSRDLVLNDWRPLASRSREDAKAAIESALAQILSGDEELRNKAISVAASMGIEQISPMLVERVQDASLSADGRAAALRALGKLAVTKATQFARLWAGNTKSAPSMRVAAIEVLAEAQPAESIKLILSATATSEDGSVRQAAWDALAKIDLPAATEKISEGVERWAAGNEPSDSALNIIEAARANGDDRLVQKIDETLKGLAETRPLAAWELSLEGGNPQRGAELFFTKTELSCVRCHKVGSQGGEVGPVLTEIGKEKDARYLLEAIVFPDAQIAKGFETTVLADDLGTTHVGIVRAETDEYVELIKADGSQVRILVDEIVARRRGQSAMPADLTKSMTLRELRDLVAYLGTLRDAGQLKDSSQHGEE